MLKEIVMGIFLLNKNEGSKKRLPPSGYKTPVWYSVCKGTLFFELMQVLIDII